MIRLLTAEDIPAAAKIEQACFSDPWSETLLQESVQNAWNHFWISEDEKGEITGYAAFSFIAGEGEIQRIGVLPQARRRGAARELMAAMEDFVRENQGDALTLEVRS